VERLRAWASTQEGWLARELQSVLDPARRETKALVGMSILLMGERGWRSLTPRPSNVVSGCRAARRPFCPALDGNYRRGAFGVSSLSPDAGPCAEGRGRTARSACGIIERRSPGRAGGSSAGLGWASAAGPRREPFLISRVDAASRTLHGQEKTDPGLDRPCFAKTWT